MRVSFFTHKLKFLELSTNQIISLPSFYSSLIMLMSRNSKNECFVTDVLKIIIYSAAQKNRRLIYVCAKHEIVGRMRIFVE